MDHRADQELVSKPFERVDPRSFALVTKLLESQSDARSSSPFSFIIQTLTGISVSRTEAPQHWKRILEHKRRLEYKLHRMVNIRTAVSDYYDTLGVTTDCPDSPIASNTLSMPGAVGLQECFPAGQGMAPLSGAIGSPVPKEDGNSRCSIRLKEEICRARRYKHALSAILLSVTSKSHNREPGIGKTPELIERIVRKIVRNVDFFAQYSEAMFLIILPDTNKREALELAGRLETDITRRAARVPGCSLDTLHFSFAVGQWSEGDAVNDFMRRLEITFASPAGVTGILEAA